MEKIMSPLFLAVALLAVVALLQLGLYLGLRLEVQQLRKLCEGKDKASRETQESLRSEVLRISEELVSMPPVQAPAAPAGSSMNLSRRNQALRMHLRGDSPLRIAAALKLSKSEVDLLLKVHSAVVPPRARLSEPAMATVSNRAGEPGEPGVGMRVSAVAQAAG